MSLTKLNPWWEYGPVKTKADVMRLTLDASLLLDAVHRMLRHHHGHACQPFDSDCAHEVAFSAIQKATRR